MSDSSIQSERRIVALARRQRALRAPSIHERIESACAIAAQLYADGADTTAADAEVDRLMAEFEEN